LDRSRYEDLQLAIKMSEICKAKYRWTREELRRAMLHHQRVKLRRGVLLIMKGFSALLLTFIGIILFAWILLPSTSAPPFWALLLLALFCIYWLIFDRLNIWYWGRGFAKRPDANIQVEWQFSQKTIKLETELGEATIQWKSFMRVVETSEGFLFYPLKNFFYWLPFPAFESPDCIEKVRKLLRENNIPLLGPRSNKRLQRTRLSAVAGE
jgi:hypothetical protein